MRTNYAVMVVLLLVSVAGVVSCNLPGNADAQPGLTEVGVFFHVQQCERQPADDSWDDDGWSELQRTRLIGEVFVPGDRTVEAVQVYRRSVQHGGQHAELILMHEDYPAFDTGVGQGFNITTDWEECYADRWFDWSVWVVYLLDDGTTVDNVISLPPPYNG